MGQEIDTKPYTPEPSRASIRYEVKWCVPQLAEWFVVGIERTEDRAREIETRFITKLRQNWTGELQTAIIKVIEEDVHA